MVKNLDRKSTRLNSSHVKISYAVFCLKKKTFSEYDITYDRGFNLIELNATILAKHVMSGFPLTDTVSTHIYTLSLHDALPISDLIKAGKRLKEFREKKGLSLREFGERIGLSHSYISNIENGKKP